jgi:hypothetical protein
MTTTITEILDAKIAEVLETGHYSITEFQLGEIPLKKLIAEYAPFFNDLDINQPIYFRGIPVKIKKTDKLAIMFLIKLNQ